MMKYLHVIIIELKSKMILRDAISEEQVNDNHERNTSKEKIQDSTLNQPVNKTKVNDHNYRWCNVSPPVFNTSFGGGEFDVPPENFGELTPLN